jgi:hypothetical protein
MNMDLEENVQEYDKFNRRVKRYFEMIMRKEVKLRSQNVIEKPALQYHSEPWMLRGEDKKRGFCGHHCISDLGMKLQVLI